MSTTNWSREDAKREISRLKALDKWATNYDAKQGVYKSVMNELVERAVESEFYVNAVRVTEIVFLKSRIANYQIELEYLRNEVERLKTIQEK